MPDDHSEVVPLLPIPNRKVKRLCADDSADSRVKVGHRQASQAETPSRLTGRFFSPVFFRPNFHVESTSQVITDISLDTMQEKSDA